jgi:hypothetical protein
MSTPEAVYTIAFEEGIDISAYLSPEETERVRQLIAQLPTGTTTSRSSPASPSSGRSSTASISPVGSRPT